MNYRIAAGLYLSLSLAHAQADSDPETLAALLEFVGGWEQDGGEWLDPMDMGSWIGDAALPEPAETAGTAEGQELKHE